MIALPSVLVVNDGLTKKFVNIRGGMAQALALLLACFARDHLTDRGFPAWESGYFDYRPTPQIRNPGNRGDGITHALSFPKEESFQNRLQSHILKADSSKGFPAPHDS